jgi:FixJ family two-component response regulator
MPSVVSRKSTVRPSISQSTVYVVDDDEGMRKSLHWLIETLGVPVKTFPSAAHFLDDYDAQGPSCLVVDVVMPGMTGLELQQELRQRGDEIPVIVLTAFGDVPSAVDAMKHGAIEFLEKPVDHDLLLECIRQGLAEDSQRRQDRGAVQFIRDRMAELTPRQNEVLDHVIEGLSSKEIATRMHVSFKTVEAHRASIMRTLKAGSVADVVRMVVSVRPRP